jgi:archaellum component FlaC
MSPTYACGRGRGKIDNRLSKIEERLSEIEEQLGDSNR